MYNKYINKHNGNNFKNRKFNLESRKNSGEPDLGKLEGHFSKAIKITGIGPSMVA